MLPAPRGWIPDRMLYPNTAGIERTATPIRFTRTHFFLSHSVASWVIFTIFSNTAITVDIAANDINIKKHVPHNLPLGIWLNTLGRVIYKSDGPASGCTS